MITIEQYPSMLTPCYNDMVFILSSDNIGEDNFNYVADLYLDAVFVQRLIVPPHPTNDSGFVNISSTMQQFISQDVDVSISDIGVSENSNSHQRYFVKFGEQYGSSGTIYSDLLTSNTLFTWNGIYDYDEFVDYSSGDIQVGSSSSRFLTNRPSSGDIYSGDNAWLYWFEVLFTTNFQRVRIITYDSVGAVIETRVILDFSVSSFDHRIPAGMNNLNNIDNSLINSGALQPIITSSVYKYSLQIVDAGGNAKSEIYYFIVAEGCSQHERINFIFLNKLGGYDCFSFTLASKQISGIERKLFKRSLGSYASPSSFNYSKSDRGNVQYHTRIKDTHTIQSDWITEEQLEWLEELVTSPDVYIDGGTELISVNVLNAAFDHKKTLTDKLFNLTLEYSYSFDRYRQKR